MWFMRFMRCRMMFEKAMMSAFRIMFALSDTLICHTPIDEIDCPHVSFPHPSFNASHVNPHE